MIAFLLLLTATLSVVSALAWLFVFPQLSKGYSSRAGRSLLDPNLQSEVVKRLLSSAAVEELGVTGDRIAFARVCLVVGLIAQASFVALLVVYY